MKIKTLFTREDMTFEEAAQYFRERVPVTADVFYALAEEYQGLAFTVSGYTKLHILKRFYLVIRVDENGVAVEVGYGLVAPAIGS